MRGSPGPQLRVTVGKTKRGLSGAAALNRRWKNEVKPAASAPGLSCRGRHKPFLALARGRPPPLPAPPAAPPAPRGSSRAAGARGELPPSLRSRPPAGRWRGSPGPAPRGEAPEAVAGGPPPPSWAGTGRGVIGRAAAAGGRGDMKRLGLLGLLGAVLLGCWEPGDAIRCFDKQYEHKGRCCNRCQPGEKLVSECNGTEDSVCARCESGHYQQSWTRERHCTPHDICEDNAGLVVKTQGNATHNTVCQCQAGMHCSDASCQTCVENQPCQRGFGFVADKAVARMSSPCEPCAEGTFSNVSSKTEPCYPWTSCEEKGLVVKVKGTNTSDAICESGRRSSLSVLIPITAAVVTCLVGICIYCLVHADPRRPVQKQMEARKPQEIPEAQQPTETEDGFFPVQETLLGGQPVAQEYGKESRISEQERL